MWHITFVCLWIQQICIWIIFRMLYMCACCFVFFNLWSWRWGYIHVWRRPGRMRQMLLSLFRTWPGPPEPWPSLLAEHPPRLLLGTSSGVDTGEQMNKMRFCRFHIVNLIIFWRIYLWMENISKNFLCNLMEIITWKKKKKSTRDYSWIYCEGPADRNQNMQKCVLLEILW